MTEAAFDTAVLDEPVSRAEVIAETRPWIEREIGKPRAGAATVLVLLRALVVIACLFVLALLVVHVVRAMAGESDFHWGSAVIAAVMVAPYAVTTVHQAATARARDERRIHRLRAFAAANGLRYDLEPEVPYLDADVFDAGRRYEGLNRVSGSRGRAFSTTDYTFDTGNARTRMPHEVTVVRLTTEHTLPAATLHCTARTAGAPGWAEPRSVPMLAIDPAFDAAFTVRAAPKHAEGVRELLGPAVRDALLAVAPSVDIELTPHAVHVVSRRMLATDSTAFWDWVDDLLRVVSLLDDPDARPFTDDATRAEERTRLFTRQGGAGRSWTIGCLVPLVFGVGAAVLSALL